MTDSTCIVDVFEKYKRILDRELPVRAVICTVCDSVFIPGETVPCNHLKALAEEFR